MKLRRLIAFVVERSVSKHRIPLTFHYDGLFPKAKTVLASSLVFVGLNDMFATLAEIAEAPVPERSAQDSVSFATYIEFEGNTGGLRITWGVDLRQVWRENYC